MLNSKLYNGIFLSTILLVIVIIIPAINGGASCM
jgi:hypothetical protein